MQVWGGGGLMHMLLLLLQEIMSAIVCVCVYVSLCMYLYGGWVGSTAPAAAAPRKAVAPRAADKPKGEAKLEYQAGGAKWMVEYQGADNGPVTVTIGDKKETVYILGCVGATVSVVGKCKSIILDGCKKTQLHFDTAFASVECVNCQRIQVGRGRWKDDDVYVVVVGCKEWVTCVCVCLSG